MQWSPPSVLANLSAQFDLLSAVPDVRYDYAVELSNWGDVQTADQVIEPLIWDRGEWGARAARLRLTLHRQYPKQFGHIDRGWIQRVLDQHGRQDNGIYSQAILYAVAHHDCQLALGWLNGIDDPTHHTEMSTQLSVYCSIEEH